MFVAREHELQVLEKLFTSDSFEMVVLYGRRRVGKTALNLNVSIVFVSLCFQGFQRIAFCAYTLLTLYFLVSLQLYTRKRPARQAERLM